MIEFVLRRLVQVGITCVVASFLVFAVMEFSPGNVASKTLGEYATPEQKEIFAQKLGLNDPLMLRYVRWLGVLTGLRADPLQDPDLGLGFTDPRGARYFGNLGYSVLYKVPVNDVLWNRLGNTALLAGLAFAVIVPLGIALGAIAGMREGDTIDRVVSLACVSLTSIPEFASAVFLIAIFAVLLGWLPGSSPLDPSGDWSLVSQLVLPAAVLVLYDVGYVARMTRASMIDVMRRNYVRTAVLKGLSWPRVVVRHGLRNAMITPFAVILLQINFLMTGVVVTEVVFAYPGFGRLILDAALYGDIALIEGATLVALVIAVSTQVAGDLGAMLLDPRVRVS